MVLHLEYADFQIGPNILTSLEYAMSTRRFEAKLR
jgi:hypothetical protein